MQTVDSQGWVQKQGRVFVIKLVSNSGEEYKITAYGVDSIADCCQNITVDESLKSTVSEIPGHVWNRPRGEVGLLIGSNLTHLMPKDCYEVDNLRIKSSMFGSGFCLQGTSRAVTLTDNCGMRVGTSAAQLEEITYAPGVRGARIQTMRVAVRQEEIHLTAPVHPQQLRSPVAIHTHDEGDNSAIEYPWLPCQQTWK